MVGRGVLGKLMNDCAGLVIVEEPVFRWPAGSFSRHSRYSLQNDRRRRAHPWPVAGTTTLFSFSRVPEVIPAKAGIHCPGAKSGFPLSRESGGLDVSGAAKPPWERRRPACTRGRRPPTRPPARARGRGGTPALPGAAPNTRLVPSEDVPRAKRLCEHASPHIAAQATPPPRERPEKCPLSRFPLSQECLELLWLGRRTYDSSLANFRAPCFLRKRIDFGVTSTSSSSLMNSKARSSPMSR